MLANTSGGTAAPSAVSIPTTAVLGSGANGQPIDISGAVKQSANVSVLRDITSTADQGMTPTASNNVSAFNAALSLASSSSGTQIWVPCGPNVSGQNYNFTGPISIIPTATSIYGYGSNGCDFVFRSSAAVTTSAAAFDFHGGTYDTISGIKMQSLQNSSPNNFPFPVALYMGRPSAVGASGGNHYCVNSAFTGQNTYATGYLIASENNIFNGCAFYQSTVNTSTLYMSTTDDFNVCATYSANCQSGAQSFDSIYFYGSKFNQTVGGDNIYLKISAAEGDWNWIGGYTSTHGGGAAWHFDTSAGGQNTAINQVGIRNEFGAGVSTAYGNLVDGGGTLFYLNSFGNTFASASLAACNYTSGGSSIVRSMILNNNCYGATSSIETLQNSLYFAQEPVTIRTGSYYNTLIASGNGNGSFTLPANNEIGNGNPWYMPQGILSPYMYAGGGALLGLAEIHTSQLATPATPTATATCASACSTAYTYQIVALTPTLESTGPSSASSSVNNNATLSVGTNYNLESWTATTGATGYYVYRTTGGVITRLGPITTNSYTDIGATGTVVGSVPSTNTTGCASFAEAAGNPNCAAPIEIGSGTSALLLGNFSANSQVRSTSTSSPLYLESGSTQPVNLCPGGQVTNCQVFSSIYHIYNLGTAPTLSSCTGGTLSSDATDAFGSVTGISGTTCTITFANAYTAPAPHCNVTSPGFTVTAYAESTTALVVTIATGSFDYSCRGK